MADISHHIIVKGKVQGVFFRVSARKVALSFGLKGWVKNTTEGDVEIVVSGNEEKLAELEQWCRTGPLDAEVQDVIVSEIPHEDFESFTIRK